MQSSTCASLIILGRAYIPSLLFRLDASPREAEDNDPKVLEGKEANKSEKGKRDIVARCRSIREMS